MSGPYRVEIEVDGSQYHRVWAVRCLGNVIARAPDCARAKHLAQEHAVATGYVPVPLIGVERVARRGTDRPAVA